MINEAIKYYLTSSNKFNLRKFKKDTSVYKDIIQNHYKHDSLEELCYMINHNIAEAPKCPTCGKTLEFSINKRRYKHHCNSQCASKDPNVIVKKEQTCLIKYGNKSFNNHEKYKQTCMQKFGYESALKSPIIRDKIYNTNYQRYGRKTYYDGERITQVCKERYGSGRNLKKIQETMRSKYGVKSYLATEEINNMRNNQEIQKKIQDTKRKNHTFNSSKLELQAYKILKKTFGEVISQYKNEIYTYNCDFYIPYLDLYIECNFHWTHGKHPFDSNNIDDLEIINKWQSKGSKYTLNAIQTWTIRDVNKRTCAQKNNLNYKEFFTIEELNKFCLDYEIQNKNQ